MLYHETSTIQVKRKYKIAASQNFFKCSIKYTITTLLLITNCMEYTSPITSPAVLSRRDCQAWILMHQTELIISEAYVLCTSETPTAKKDKTSTKEKKPRIIAYDKTHSQLHILRVGLVSTGSQLSTSCCKQMTDSWQLRVENRKTRSWPPCLSLDWLCSSVCAKVACLKTKGTAPFQLGVNWCKLPFGPQTVC